MPLHLSRDMERLLVLTIITFLVGLKDVLGIHFNNTLCRPRPVVIATDPDNFRYYPYYVILYRCSGSVQNYPPTQQQCVPSNIATVDVNVLVRGQWSKSDGQERRTVKALNHTRCGKGCVAKPTDCDTWQKFDADKCACTCPYTFAPAKCGQWKRWNPVTCACDCISKMENCQLKNPSMIWSPRSCGCQCSEKSVSKCKKIGQTWDEKTCECIGGAATEQLSATEVQGTLSEDLAKFIGTQQFWYCVVVSEFMLLCVIFDLILYHKRSGLLYRLANCYRNKTVTANGSTHNLTTGMEDVD